MKKTKFRKIVAIILCISMIFSMNSWAYANEESVGVSNITVSADEGNAAETEDSTPVDEGDAAETEDSTPADEGNAAETEDGTSADEGNAAETEDSTPADKGNATETEDSTSVGDENVGGGSAVLNEDDAFTLCPECGMAGMHLISCPAYTCPECGQAESHYADCPQNTPAEPETSAAEALLEAASVEEMYLDVLALMNTAPDALMALNADEIAALRARISELDPEGDDTDTGDLLDTLAFLPNSAEISPCTCEAAEGEAHRFGCALYEKPEIPRCDCPWWTKWFTDDLQKHDEDCVLRLFCTEIARNVSVEELAGQLWNDMPLLAKNYLWDNLTAEEQAAMAVYGIGEPADTAAVTVKAADVYADADYTQIENYSIESPLDVETCGETVYVATSTEAQEVYFARADGAEFSTPDTDRALVTPEGKVGLLHTDYYKRATVTLAPGLEAGDTVSLTAAWLDVSWGDWPETVTRTITIKMIAPRTEGTVAPEVKLPECDCDYTGDGGLVVHADSCGRKNFCKDVSAESVGHIAAIWQELTADMQDFILIYLSWTDPEKLAELDELLNGKFEEEIEIEPIDESVFAVEFSGGEDLTVTVAEPEVAHAVKEAPPASKYHHVTWRGVYDIEAEAATDITLAGLPEFGSELIEIRHYLDDAASVASALSDGKAHYLSVCGFEDYFSAEIAAVQEADPNADGSTVCYVVISSEDGDIEIDGLEGGAKSVTFHAESYSLYEVSIVFVAPTSYIEAASNGSAVSESGIRTGKTVSYDEDEGYKLRIESYVTGSATTSTVTTYKPTDFVLSIDISHSMPPCINCGTSGIDATSTGLHGAHSHCKVYPDELDLNEVYYRSTNETNPLYYCHGCEDWYSEEHTNDSHGGQVYICAYPNGTDYTAQFYSEAANVNCGESCTHKAWSHPIYMKDLDTDAAYTKTAGSSAAANLLVYCEDCGFWYPGNDADHAPGDTHESAIYHPFKIPNDPRNGKDVQFYQSCVSRMQAAKEAVAAFIEQVKEMSKGPDNIAGTDDDIKHRVAIIGFGGDDTGDAKVGVADYQTITGRAKGQYTGTGIYSLYEDTNDEGLGYYSSTNSYNNFESYHIIKNDEDLAAKCYSNALRDVTEPAEYDVLEEGIRELNYNYGTYISFASVMAEQIFAHTYSDDERDGMERNRVAVFFTDGQPDGDGEGVYDLADESIQPAYRMKNNEKGEVTVYAIGIFAKADASKIWHLTDDNANQDEYMHMLSSNYPTAYKFEGGRKVRDVGSTTNRKVEKTDINARLLKTAADGTVSVDTGKGGYYLTAANASELVDVFEGIAQDTSTGGASVTLDSETIVQDVIADGWEIKIESGETAADKIDVYTMAYVGEDVWEDTTDEFVSVVSGKTVSVTGFDFSENYVGIDYEQGRPTYRGKKLVMVIPIKPAEDNLGGLAQPTNVRSLSGIYYDTNKDGELTNDEMEQAFKVPAVDLPAKVTVSKIVEKGNSFAKSYQFAFAGSYKTPNDSDLYDGNDGSDGNYLQMKAAENDGQINTSLADGQKFELAEVMVGSILKIKETNSEGYLVKVEINVDPNADAEDTDSGGDGYEDDSTEEEIIGDEAGGSGNENAELWYEITDVDADGYYNIIVEPGLEIRVTNTLQRADLVITKKGAETIDTNQTFIFSVQGMKDTVTGEVDMDIVINGNDCVIIKDLPVGAYKIIEDTDWSWRYTPDADIKTLTLKADTENAVIFTNVRDTDIWLDGNTWCRNIFNSTDNSGQQTPQLPHETPAPAQLAVLREEDTPALIVIV